MHRLLIVLAVVFLSLPGEAADNSLVALSLKTAEKIVANSASPADAAEHFGGITQLMGLMYDRQRQDIVLIGQIEQGRPALNLADFVVALRAVLVRREWPLVSIDPTPETRSTGKQNVRFEGGIADSSFAKALLDADVALKGLGIGSLKMNGLPSFFDIRAAGAKTRLVEARQSNQMWFCALEPLLEQREDVFAIRDLKIGVRTRPSSQGETSDAPSDEAADTFAANLTGAFETLSQAIPEIQQLRGLFEMVALADGIRSLSDGDLSYWLKEYHVPAVETPKEFDYVVRRELVPTADGIRSLEVGGGVNLKVLSIRIQDGDITALKEAVLLSRPQQDVLTWIVPLSDWSIPSSAQALDGQAPPIDRTPGSTLSSRFVGNAPPADRGAQPTRPQTNRSSVSADSLNEPFRVVDPADVTIVSPPSNGPVITLPSDRRGAPKSAPPKAPAAAPPAPEPPSTMYRQGADGLHYLKATGLDEYLQDVNRYPQSGASTPPTAITPQQDFLSSPPSKGIGFDLAVKESPDGRMKATPHVEGDLRLVPNRHFNRTVEVTLDDKPIADGFSDVIPLGNGRFAAKYSPFGNDDYAIFDGTGKAVSSHRFRYVQPLGDGYFAVPGSGIGMMEVWGYDMKSTSYTYPAYEIPTYEGNGKLTLMANGNPRFINLPASSRAPVPAPPPPALNPAPQPAAKVVDSAPPQLAPKTVGGIKAEVKIDDSDFGPLKTASAARYSGAEIRASEEKREQEPQGRLAELRQRFVDGPVLLIPGRGSAASDSVGAFVIAGVGTVYFHTFRSSGDWGTLVAERGVLVARDGRSRSVPAPVRRDDVTFTGDGWTFKAAAGWIIREGARRGDYEVVPR